MKKYHILSPDGIEIDQKEFYRSLDELKKAFIAFRNKFKKQGYYSSNEYGHINLKALHMYCQLIEF